MGVVKVSDEQVIKEFVILYFSTISVREALNKIEAITSLEQYEKLKKGFIKQ